MSNYYFNDESIKTPISDDYTIQDQLGDGGFSVVKRGVHKETEEVVAIKTIKKVKMGPADVKREVDIWKLASDNSERVVQLYHIYEDHEYVYLVMELMKGGELFDKILAMQDYNEKYASTIIKQVLMVIRDLHKVHIVHQDMKPENLLLEDKDSNVIKLCDFGLAEIATDEVELVGLAGSTPYMAPEVVEGNGHSQPVDVYASGVIMYILLCGYPPFEPENGIVDLEFPSPEWDMISPVAKNLITKLLCADPDSRPSPDEALKHPWFKDVETIKLCSKPLKRTTDTLKRYQEMLAKGKPSSSMKEFRGQGRSSVMEIFKEQETVKENTSTSLTTRKESLSESASASTASTVGHNGTATIDEVMALFRAELTKTKERILAARSDNSNLRIKLAELTASREEIESRMKWDIELIKREAEEERKKRKKLEAQIRAILLSAPSSSTAAPSSTAASSSSSSKSPLPAPSSNTTAVASLPNTASSKVTPGKKAKK